MDDEELDSKYCLLVKIVPAMSAEDAQVAGDEDDNCLEIYLENITKNSSKFFRFNGTRSYAIVKFEQPICDINELQKKSDEKPLMAYKITLKTIPLVDSVLVTDLPDTISNSDDLAECELVLYFENKKFCPDGGEVKKREVLPCRHAAVVQFADHAVVRKLKADHKLGELHFIVRPLNIFEFVEGPCCSVCNEDKGGDDTSEDTEQASWHSAHEDNEDTGSWKNETQSGSQSNSDSEELEKLKNWDKKNEGTNSQSQNEYSSFTGRKSSSCKKFTEPDNSERTELLLKTIKYKRIPGLIPEECDMIKLTKSNFEIMEHDKKKNDHIRKVIEDAGGFGEVDLADYTTVAGRLNSKIGRKWITELLDDLKIPATVMHDKSTLSLRAISLDLAEEAAKTVASSLLPAKIKCDRNQMNKCSKLLQDKILMHILCKSGYLELLGMPMDVLKAVGEIEQKLHGSSWPIR